MYSKTSFTINLKIINYNICRVAVTGEVVPDPDPTFEKKNQGPDLTVQYQPESVLDLKSFKSEFA